MSNFIEALRKDFEEAFEIFEHMDVDLSNVNNWEEFEKATDDFHFYSEGVWSEDVERFFASEEEGKDFLLDYHSDVCQADDPEEFAEDFYFDKTGPYVENWATSYQDDLTAEELQSLEKFFEFYRKETGITK